MLSFVVRMHGIRHTLSLFFVTPLSLSSFLCTSLAVLPTSSLFLLFLPPLMCSLRLCRRRARACSSFLGMLTRQAACGSPAPSHHGVSSLDGCPWRRAPPTPPVSAVDPGSERSRTWQCGLSNVEFPWTGARDPGSGVLPAVDLMRKRADLVGSSRTFCSCASRMSQQ